MNFAKQQLGGPFGLCFAIVVCLSAGSAIGFKGIGTALAWYVTVAGIGYAGRFPIHILGCKYATHNPKLEMDLERRRWRYQLNVLVFLNLLSIIAWAAVAIYLHKAIGGSIVLRSGVCIALFAAVFALAAFTVDLASKLELMRGSEWICSSKFGRVFLYLDGRTPRRSPPGFLFVRFKDLTPSDQVSAFVILVSCSLLAFPASGIAGMELGRLLREELPGAGPEASQEGGGRNMGPLYEDQCPGLPVPGAPAPSPQRQQLHALWLDGERFGIESAGAEQAGCAHSAKPVGGQPGAYYALGFCGSTLRSFGLTSANYLPALIFQPAAGFALQLARDGVLIGASRRHPARGGDYYVIDTTYGSWLLIRSSPSNGKDKRTDGDLACERIAANNVDYRQIPPGLVNIWQQLTGELVAWPQQVFGKSNGRGEFVFRSEDPSAEPVATASCSSATFCTAWFEGHLYSTSGSLYATVEAIDELAR